MRRKLCCLQKFCFPSPVLAPPQRRIIEIVKVDRRPARLQQRTCFEVHKSTTPQKRSNEQGADPGRVETLTCRKGRNQARRACRSAQVPQYWCDARANTLASVTARSTSASSYNAGHEPK